jgi:hypothetical protein
VKYIVFFNIDMKKIIFAFVILITILITIYSSIIWNTNQIIKQLFNGFYSADPIFCEDSSLDMMMIYFDNGDGYILIKGVDGSILINDVIEYKLINKTNFNTSLNNTLKYQIIFKGIDYQEFFPTRQFLEFTPSSQKIKLFSDEKVYGLLYKNNMVSDVKDLIDF